MNFYLVAPTDVIFCSVKAAKSQSSIATLWHSVTDSIAYPVNVEKYSIYPEPYGLNAKTQTWSVYYCSIPNPNVWNAATLGMGHFFNVYCIKVSTYRRTNLARRECCILLTNMCFRELSVLLLINFILINQKQINKRRWIEPEVTLHTPHLSATLKSHLTHPE